MADIRLNKLTRRFNLSLANLVEFLRENGLVVDYNPNAKISDNYLSLLEEKFGHDSSYDINYDKGKSIGFVNKPIGGLPDSSAAIKSADCSTKSAEKKWIYPFCHVKKANAVALKNYLLSNGVDFFYHFTDLRNLDSIEKHGGLFSWRYCEDHNITIPFPGGDSTSRSLDSYHGLSNYVRLSFCLNHPMKWVLEQKGYNMVLLRVKIDVACFEGTLFSDINATDSNHKHGGTLNDLKRVNIPATQENYVSKTSPFFKMHQAEVMVKTFIPIEYIEIPSSTQQDLYIDDSLPF